MSSDCRGQRRFVYGVEKDESHTRAEWSSTQSTVRLNVTDCVVDPEVAVTVIGYCPAGVPDCRAGVLPPHAAIPIKNSKIISGSEKRRLRKRIRGNSKATANGGHTVAPPDGMKLAAAVRAVVLTDTVTATELLFNVVDEGFTLHEPFGGAPEQVICTLPDPDKVRGKLAVCPAVTVMLVEPAAVNAMAVPFPVRPTL